MTGAPPGAVVSIYVDSRSPIEVGDEITTRTGRRYEVEGVRVQTRGAHLGRQHLKVRVLDSDHPHDPDVTVHRLSWYSRR